MRPDLFQPRCDTCDRVRIFTPSGFLVCPQGHGALHLDESLPEVPEVESFLMFLDPIGA